MVEQAQERNHISNPKQWLSRAGTAGFPPRASAAGESGVPLRRFSRIVFILIIGLFVLLAGRLLYINFTSHAALKDFAERQQQMRIALAPHRGSILDRRLRVLAASVDAESAFADPLLIKDIDAASRRIGPILRLPASQVRQSIERAGTAGKRFVWLKRRLTDQEAEAVRKASIRGISLVTEGSRSYPNCSLAAHIIGMVGADCQGLEGIENLFNDRLTGQGSYRLVKADARRRPLWAECSAKSGGETAPPEPCDGQTLVLTIDKVIQSFVEAELKEVVAKYRAKGATGIVMDPQTGEILAMANLPVYDPNNYSESPHDSRRNRAITDPYEPGSTFKVFIAAAALAKGVARMDEEIFCENGQWRYRSRVIHDHHPYGRLTFREIVIKSSNVAMAKLGVRLGDEELRNSVLAFGFGSRTGIFLPGEDPGFVQPAHRWSYWTTTSVPFGQEVTVTPLQLVTAFSTFGNGGRLLRPKIVRGILDSRGQPAVDMSRQPEVVAQVLPTAIANAFKDEILVGVVEQGTGKSCKIPGYKVFGKTGTAQKTIRPSSGRGRPAGYGQDLYVASFVAGAPASNPRVVVLVAVDEPDKSKGYYGGTVAAPAVKAILEKTLTYLGVPKDDLADTDGLASRSGSR